jgi:hypothetical protein
VVVSLLGLFTFFAAELILQLDIEELKLYFDLANCLDLLEGFFVGFKNIPIIFDAN